MNQDQLQLLINKDKLRCLQVLYLLLPVEPNPVRHPILLLHGSAPKRVHPARDRLRHPVLLGVLDVRGLGDGLSVQVRQLGVHVVVCD